MIAPGSTGRLSTQHLLFNESDVNLTQAYCQTEASLLNDLSPWTRRWHRWPVDARDSKISTADLKIPGVCCITNFTAVVAGSGFSRSQDLKRSIIHDTVKKTVNLQGMKEDRNRLTESVLQTTDVYTYYLTPVPRIGAVEQCCACALLKFKCALNVLLCAKPYSRYL